jgi:transposase
MVGSARADEAIHCRRAYDADRLRTWLQDKGTEAAIPGRAARAVVYPLNHTAYRRGTVIERRFGRLKSWKRMETRYDRLAISPPSPSLRRLLNGLGESTT